MSSVRLAGVVWLLSASVYLACEAIAAARSPGYSYTADFISDLGTEPVMNYGAFMVHGMLFLTGAALVARGVGATAAGRVFVLAALANAVGNILVGSFPSGSAQAHWHVVGAGLAIVGGNAALVVAGFAGRAPGATPAFRRMSVALGCFGLMCLAALVIDGADGSHLLEPGLVERGAVYPIIAWEIVAALALLRTRSRVRGAVTEAH